MNPSPRRTPSVVVKLVLLTAVFTVGLTSTAAASFTIGSLFEADPSPNSPGSRYVPVRTADGSEYAGSPIAGVLTSVTVETSGSGGTLKIPVMRPAGPLSATVDYMIANSTIEMTVTADATASGHLTSVDTRVSIAAGDRLGLDYEDGTMKATQLLDGSGQFCGYRALLPPQAVGEVASYNAANCNSWWPSVQGTVEADADADGFGDETQDLCPTDATRQSTCPAAPVLPLPANLVVTVARSKGKLGSAATRSFTVKNVGPSAATPVTFALSSSKKVRKYTFVKGCKAAKGGSSCVIATLAPGASVTIKVKVTPKSSASTRLTAKVTTPGEAATSDNSASTTVKFKPKK